MAEQRYQVIKSEPVSTGRNLCTVFIEDFAALGEIPGPISKAFAIGSAAYTTSLDIYFLTTEGWELSS